MPFAHTLSATQALSLMQAGQLTSEALVQACLQQITRREAHVHAWQYLDAEAALHAARACDAQRRMGAPCGTLHGLPVAMKDNIDTQTMPTTYGSPLYAGHQPARDATVVSQLRAAGAIVLGKTVSTEFAYYTPGPTHNPHRRGHTPGGSSSGSAAAVAAGMVPLALGTQTNGSVIRPAAFCGVLGYKPARGQIAREGVLTTSHTLDQVGFFARTLDDLALLTTCLAPALAAPSSMQPAHLRIGRIDSPLMARAEPVTVRLLQHTQQSLQQAGMQVATVALGALHLQANALHRTIMAYEMAQSLAAERARGSAAMSAALLQLLDQGQATSAQAYSDALHRLPELTQAMALHMAPCEVLLLPSAPGPAPEGIDSTGDPVFCSLASLLGWPALHLPLGHDTQGLPIGVQLLAQPGQEAALHALARTLLTLSGQSQGTPIAGA